METKRYKTRNKIMDSLSHCKISLFSPFFSIPFSSYEVKVEKFINNMALSKGFSPFPSGPLPESPTQTRRCSKNTFYFA